MNVVQDKIESEDGSPAARRSGGCVRLAIIPNDLKFVVLARLYILVLFFESANDSSLDVLRPAKKSLVKR